MSTSDDQPGGSGDSPAEPAQAPEQAEQTESATPDAEAAAKAEAEGQADQTAAPDEPAPPEPGEASSTPSTPGPEGTPSPPGASAPSSPLPPPPGAPGHAGPPPPAGPAAASVPPGPLPPVPPGPPGWPAPAPRSPVAGKAGLSLAHFLVPALTLGVGLLMGAGVFFSADVPDGFIGDRFVPYAALLAALAATVGLLVSWGEQDLSFVGIVTVAGYIYIDVSEENVLAAVLLSLLAGLAIGAVIGVVRWLTRAPSAVLSLAVGLVASTAYLQLSDAVDAIRARMPAGEVEGSGAQLLAAFVFVAAAVALGVLLGRPGQGMGTLGPDGSAGVGPRVIAGFALSGAAAGAVGALFTGSVLFGPPSGHWNLSVQIWLVPVFAAVAIGGVLRGSWFLAPIGAALGAVAAVLLSDGVRFRGWEPISAELVLVGFLVGSLVVSYGLQRVLDGPGRTPTGETPMAPPGQPVPF